MNAAIKNEKRVTTTGSVVNRAHTQGSKRKQKKGGVMECVGNKTKKPKYFVFSKSKQKRTATGTRRERIERQRIVVALEREGGLERGCGGMFSVLFSDDVERRSSID